MKCNLCSDLSSRPEAEGACQGTGHSQIFVCTNGRPDNTAHGERCQCHCDELFCLTHARAHLNDISEGTMAECFPALSMSLAGPVLTAVVGLTLRRADASGTDHTPHASDKNMRTIALFLSFATPGIDELIAAQDNDPGISELTIAEDQLWPVERLHVTDAFLTSDRLEKIMGIATRQIVDVWSGRGPRGRSLVREFAAYEPHPSPLSSVMRRQFVDSLADTLASQSESQAMHFEPRFDHVEAARALSRHPRASEDAVDPFIMSALRRAATVPRSAREMAGWLLASDEQEEVATSENYSVLVR